MAAIETSLANAFETQLTANVTDSDLTFPVGSIGSLTSPTYLVIDPDNPTKREYVFFDGTFTTSDLVTTSLGNRGLAGSASGAQGHTKGAKVRAVPMQQHFEDLHDRMDTAYTVGGVDVAVTDGGTGASSAPVARANLGAAADAEVVHLAGAETISGAKTFSVDPTLADGSSALSLTEGNAAYLGRKSFVHDVTAYGATGDGVADDYTAFVNALAAIAAAGGGVLFVPEGTYLINSGAASLDIPSNTIVCGQGRGSLIKRGASYGQQMIFRINGTNHVTVERLACDFNNAGAFFRFVGLRGTDPHHLRFLDNRIFDSNPNTATAGDKWAFNLTAETGTVSHVWIERNHSSNDMQLTSGGKSFFNVWVTDNYVEGGRSNGIALTQLGDNMTFENIVVSGNSVNGTVGVGIVVGPDNDGVARLGTVGRNIKVVNNTVRFTTPAATAIGIEVRHFNTQSNVKVTGNRVLEVSGATNSAEGIRVLRESTLTPAAIAENVIVANNLVERFGVGYRLQFLTDVLMAGNVARNSGTYGAYVRECSDVTIVGNYIADAAHCLYIQACADVDIRGNTVHGGIQNFGGILTLAGSSTASITTLSANVIGNRLGPKSGTNTVYGILQTGSGAFTTRLLLNDVTGTNGINPSAGTFAARWLNQGEGGQRASYPVEEFTGALTWDPPSMADGATTSTTLTLGGVAVGDVATATFSTIGANDVLVSAHVQAANTVRVVLMNKTGAALDLLSGTLRVSVRRPA